MAWRPGTLTLESWPDTSTVGFRNNSSAKDGAKTKVSAGSAGTLLARINTNFATDAIMLRSIATRGEGRDKPGAKSRSSEL